jgi:alpha-amylase
MTKPNLKVAVLAALIHRLPCNSNDDYKALLQKRALSKVIDVTHHDGQPFSTGNP